MFARGNGHEKTKNKLDSIFDPGCFIDRNNSGIFTV